jgi:pyruvate formate lyase activating enzyme
MSDDIIIVPGKGADTVPTKYWEKLSDGRIMCTVCPRECKMKEGQRGLCFVRKAENDQVVMTSYGRSSGFCIDPIEKKPLNHFLPGTPILSLGTAGCNLACSFCQNWDISKAREMDRIQDLAAPEMVAKAAYETGCRSVAFTYTDPVIFMEYAIDIAQACHERDIKTVAVTAGYINEEPRKEFYKYMDAANVDLKAFTEDFYWRQTKGHLKPVLDTLVYLKEHTDVWFEITTLLIPDENDSTQEITEQCDWIIENLGPDVPLHFSAFHPDYRMRDKAKTPPATLKRARSIAQDNMWDLSDEGACAHCGTAVSGVFDGKAGDWGRKRLPVRISSDKIEIAPSVSKRSDPQKVKEVRSYQPRKNTNYKITTSCGIVLSR